MRDAEGSAAAWLVQIDLYRIFLIVYKFFKSVLKSDTEVTELLIMTEFDQMYSYNTTVQIGNIDTAWK